MVVVASTVMQLGRAGALRKAPLARPAARPTDLDTYWVPGPSDAPVEDYLREAHNIELVSPFLHGVHGTAAFAPGTVLVAGFGGEVDDDPASARDEVERLRYPRWEVEYRLKLIGRELSEHEQTLILLFSTPPAHKGRAAPGSEALAELAELPLTRP